MFSLTTAPFAARPKRAFSYDWTLNGTIGLSNHKAVMMEYELAAE